MEGICGDSGMRRAAILVALLLLIRPLNLAAILNKPAETRSRASPPDPTQVASPQAAAPVGSLNFVADTLQKMSPARGDQAASSSAAVPRASFRFRVR